MDLKDLDIKSETITTILTHPITGEVLTKKDGTDMSVTTYGVFSPQYKIAVNRISNIRLKQVSKTGKIDLTAEEIEENNLNRLVETTVGWNLQLDGKDVVFSKDTAKEIYIRFPFIRYQAVADQEDMTNFFG